MLSNQNLLLVVKLHGMKKSKASYQNYFDMKGIIDQIILLNQYKHGVPKCRMSVSSLELNRATNESKSFDRFQ